jgi:hypothetical protein
MKRTDRNFREARQERWIALVCFGIVTGIIFGILADKYFTPIVEVAEAEVVAPAPMEVEVRLEIVYNWDKEKIIEEIKKAFPEDPQTAVAIVKCESNFVVDIQSKHQLSYGREQSFGLFQIHAKAWDRKAKQLGYGDYKTSPRDNIDMARWIYEQSGKKWGAWSCYSKGMI